MTSFALLLFLAPAALAQPIDVTVSLDLTGGLARVGAYVPVTVEATNRTDRAVAEVHLSTGGPVAVDLRARWHLAPGERGEKVFPVFYAGGDLALQIAFRDAEGHVIARVDAPVPDLKPVPEDAAVLWIRRDVPEPDDAQRASLRRRMGGRRVYVRRLPAMDFLWRFYGFGLVDAVGLSASEPGRPPVLQPVPARVPGAGSMVQPEICALLGSHGRGAGNRLHLWLGLAVFAGAVLAFSVIASRCRAVVAVVGLLVLAAGATGAVRFLGGAGQSRQCQWRLVWMDPAWKVGYVERFVAVESRGGAGAGLHMGHEADAGVPLPLFASPDEVFRPFAVIRADATAADRGRGAWFRTLRPRCVLHLFERDEQAWGAFALNGPAEKLPSALADRPDVVAALGVEGREAVDARGRRQPVDAWAVAWKESGDPDLAWAGRTLAWWDAHRRTGDGPFLVAWFRDPASDPPLGVDAYQRMPAMVVYGE
ncbi:MAG: hypothetical protein U9R68_08165 [Planctomycetota bacterium]|nr:hypothetical protein [Planctomycetota bacterium]